MGWFRLLLLSTCFFAVVLDAGEADVDNGEIDDDDSLKKSASRLIELMKPFKHPDGGRPLTEKDCRIITAANLKKVLSEKSNGVYLVQEDTCALKETDYDILIELKHQPNDTEVLWGTTSIGSLNTDAIKILNEKLGQLPKGSRVLVKPFFLKRTLRSGESGFKNSKTPQRYSTQMFSMKPIDENKLVLILWDLDGRPKDK